jgi:hypothetical protein
MWNVEPTVIDRREEVNCKALKKNKENPSKHNDAFGIYARKKPLCL